MGDVDVDVPDELAGNTAAMGFDGSSVAPAAGHEAGVLDGLVGSSSKQYPSGIVKPCSLRHL